MFSSWEGLSEPVSSSLTCCTRSPTGPSHSQPAGTSRTIHSHIPPKAPAPLVFPNSNPSLFPPRPCVSNDCQQREQGGDPNFQGFLPQESPGGVLPSLKHGQPARGEGVEISSSSFMGGKDEGWEAAGWPAGSSPRILIPGKIDRKSRVGSERREKPPSRTRQRTEKTKEKRENQETSVWLTGLVLIPLYLGFLGAIPLFFHFFFRVTVLAARNEKLKLPKSLCFWKEITISGIKGRGFILGVAARTQSGRSSHCSKGDIPMSGQFLGVEGRNEPVEGPAGSSCGP